MNICLRGFILSEQHTFLVVILMSCCFLFPSQLYPLFFVSLCLLQTSILNKHLQELMDGLTAKVFRTYNASITLQQQLKELSCCE